MITFDMLLAYMLGMIVSAIMLLTILKGWTLFSWRVKRFFIRIRLAINSIRKSSQIKEAKPAFGVMPKTIWLENRHKEVRKALFRQDGRNKELEGKLEEELYWLDLSMSQPNKKKKIKKKEPLKERLENLGVN